MKLVPKTEEAEIVKIDMIAKTTEAGQITLINLTLGDGELTLTEEQAVNLTFDLASVLPNSLKTQLASQVITNVGLTFR